MDSQTADMPKEAVDVNACCLECIDELGGKQKEGVELQWERHMQEAMLNIKKKYGKNAILKGMNLQEGATAKDRNAQIGGHKA